MIGQVGNKSTPTSHTSSVSKQLPVDTSKQIATNGMNVPTQTLNPDSLSTSYNGREYIDITHEFTTYCIGSAACLAALAFQIIIQHRNTHRTYIVDCESQLSSRDNNGTIIIERDIVCPPVDLNEHFPEIPKPSLLSIACPLLIGLGAASLYYYKGFTRKSSGRPANLDT